MTAEKANGNGRASAAAVSGLRDRLQAAETALRKIADFRLVSTADYNAFEMGEIARAALAKTNPPQGERPATAQADEGKQP